MKREKYSSSKHSNSSSFDSEFSNSSSSFDAKNCRLEYANLEHDFNVLRLYYEAVLEHYIYQTFWTNYRYQLNIPTYYDEMDPTTNYSTLKKIKNGSIVL